jgi:hypothetical protein
MSLTQGTLDNFVSRNQVLHDQVLHNPVSSNQNLNQVNEIYYQQADIRPPRPGKKQKIGIPQSTIKQIKPQNIQEIAIRVSPLVIKQAGHKIPEIDAFEAIYVSTRKKDGETKLDTRYGLQCRFCQGVFKYLTFFNSQHWLKCSQRSQKFTLISFNELTQDDKFYFYMSLFISKFNISARQFARKDIQDIFNFFINTKFSSTPKITEKILISKMKTLSNRFQTSSIDFLIAKGYPIYLLIDSGTNRHIHSTQILCSCPGFITPFIWKSFNCPHQSTKDFATMVGKVVSEIDFFLNKVKLFQKLIFS